MWDSKAFALSHIFPSLLCMAHNYPQNSPTIMIYTRLQGFDHQRSYGLNQGVCPRIKIPKHSHEQQSSASHLSPNRGAQIIKEMETEASAPQNKSEHPPPPSWPKMRQKVTAVWSQSGGQAGFPPSKILPLRQPPHCQIPKELKRVRSWLSASKSSFHVTILH